MLFTALIESKKAIYSNSYLIMLYQRRPFV